VGLELARQFSNKGDVEVTALSRSQPAVAVASYFPFDALSEQELPPFEGALDGLVYCPGSILLKPFDRLGVADFRADMEINFFGAVRVLQHFRSSLKAGENASVVLFSSVAAAVGMLYHSSIASAKGAIEGLVRSLAAEFAPSIRVNGIAPSLVQTRLSEKLTNSEGKMKVAMERHPLKRIGTTDDIVSAAIYLLSENASWITGQIIPVDGGMSAIRM